MTRKQHGWWSESKKLEAVTTYLAVGSSKMVEAITGIPAGTIRKWRTEPWWRELEGLLREENALETNSKLKRIVDKSLDQVMDRLENGDIIWNPKTGAIERRPAYLKDVAKVMHDAMDRQAILTKITGSDEAKPKLDAQLKELAAEFAKIVRGDKPDAVHEERKEGLQEGEREVQLEARGEEEEGGEESRESGDGESGESTQG
jgi:hypothetical protein